MKYVTDEMLDSWCKHGAVPDHIVLIDIREPSEFAREHIKGSKNIPVNNLDGCDFSHSQEQIAIFYCQMGNRTKSALDKIENCGFKEVYCLPNGLEQWKKCGLPTVVNRNAPIDIMRQVQITAGSLVLLGVVLGYLLSPYFYILSGFVGAGLMFAGISGTCGMAKLLGFMPWNKTRA